MKFLPLLAAIIVYSTGVAAGDWSIVPRFSLGETYSDNVQLDSFNERDDFVTRATPGVSVRGVGRRVEMNVDYNLQSLTYANNSRLNNINHQLQSDASVELFRHNVFFDADALMYQALISNTGRISNRNFRASGNRASVLSYGFGPRVEYRFGSWAELDGRFEYTATEGDGRGGSSSAGSGSGTNLTARLSSGRRFSRTSWGLSGSRRRYNSENRTSGGSSREDVTADLSVAINRYFRINSSVGYQDNNSRGGGRNGKGMTWSMGGTVTIGRRGSVTGAFNHRPFGDTKTFSFDYRRRHFSVSGTYTEELRTTSEQLRAQRLVALTDPFGEPIFDPNNAVDIDLPLGTLSFTDELYLSRDFHATVGYVQRRDTFTATVFRSEREQDSRSTPEMTIGTSANWTHSFSRRLSGGINGSFRSGNGSRFSTGGPRAGGNNSQEADVIIVSPYMNYTIGPHTNGRLSYSYTVSTSDDPFSEYIENSVSGSLTFAF